VQSAKLREDGEESAELRELISQRMLGPGVWLSNFAVVSAQLGVASAYVIFIATNLNSILPSMATWQWALLTAIPLYALCESFFPVRW